jgi:hypothetical protein
LTKDDDQEQMKRIWQSGMDEREGKERKSDVLKALKRREHLIVDLLRVRRELPPFCLFYRSFMTIFISGVQISQQTIDFLYKEGKGG